MADGVVEKVDLSAEDEVIGVLYLDSNIIFSTQHIVHTTIFFFTQRVEKGASRRQSLCEHSGVYRVPTDMESIEKQWKKYSCHGNS